MAVKKYSECERMKTILLIGSSIFESWGNADGLAPACTIKNRAVGGTITSYWKENIANVLIAESPDAVLLYCGSNDVNGDIPESDIVANTLHCCETLHNFLPAAAFAWFSIIKAPQKYGKWDLIDRINTAVRNGLHPDDLYVDTDNIFLCDGHALEYLYVWDGLHLTEQAYAAMSAYAQPILADWLR